MNLAPPLDPAVLEQSIGLFRLSRMIFAAASLRIAEHLAAGPLDAEALARATDTHPASLASLLDVRSAWGVFERKADTRYALTSFSERMVPGAPNAANLPRAGLRWTRTIAVNPHLFVLEAVPV